MATTTEPLTDQELDRILERLPSIDDFDRYAFLLLLYTGAHPSVLSDPIGHNLQLDGDRYLQWRRPKTRTLMRIPIDPAIRPWIRPFLERLVPTHRQFYGRLVARVARACGISGCSARTLRHTYGKLVYRTTHDVNETARLVGCTLLQAMEYARTTERPADAQLLRDGLSLRS